MVVMVVSVVVVVVVNSFDNPSCITLTRLTTEDPRAPWELRMNIYVMPADLRDCSFSTYMP